jgi:hypothetical protein
MMFCLQLTKSLPHNSRMRSEFSSDGNNMNSIDRFLSNPLNMFMLFDRSYPIVRAKTVICVLI